MMQFDVAPRRSGSIRECAARGRSGRRALAAEVQTRQTDIAAR
jgi:hypothetical protein